MKSPRQTQISSREQAPERRQASQRRMPPAGRGREYVPKDRLLGMLCFQIGLCALLLTLLVTARFIGGSSLKMAQEIAVQICGIGQEEIQIPISKWMPEWEDFNLWTQSKELFEKLREGFAQALHNNLATENPAGTVGESAYEEKEEEKKIEEEHSLQTNSNEEQAVLQGGQGGLLPLENNMTFGFLEAPENATFAPYLLSAALWTPVAGQVTSLFGYRYHPISSEPDFHTGLDIAAPPGTAIHAALPGTVEETGWSESYGNYIKLRHSPQLVTTYSHCLEILAQKDERLSRGDRIAFVGSTGVSTGPHLHFEVQINNKNADPMLVLKYSYTNLS